MKRRSAVARRGAWLAMGRVMAVHTEADSRLEAMIEVESMVAVHPGAVLVNDGASDAETEAGEEQDARIHLAEAALGVSRGDAVSLVFSPELCEHACFPAGTNEHVLVDDGICAQVVAAEDDPKDAIPTFLVSRWHLLKRRPQHDVRLELDTGQHWDTENMSSSSVACTERKTENAENILCKRWIYLGTCDAHQRHGLSRKKCPFRHHFINEKEEREVRRVRASRADLISHGFVECAGCIDGHSCSEAFDSAKRSSIFVSWILRTFKIDQLAVGDGLLDVGGSKGHNCIQILEQSGCTSLQTTVIDPIAKESNLTERQRCRITEMECKLPKFFCKAFDANFVNSKEGFSLMHRCSCLIGLHPDQATGSILQEAIRFKKPFAVVPCCVFAGQFYMRRTKSGVKVTNMSSFLTWLLELHPNIQMDELALSGRNKVLYMLPHHFES